MSATSQWTIDEAVGHIAHPSGLYAYFSNAPTDSGGILCVGPFSSYTRRLTRADVFSHTREAIRALENDRFLDNCYTLWGTYLNPGVHVSSRKIDILGQSFDFVANPTFRTTTLLCSYGELPAQKDLLREWCWNNESNVVTHRVGLQFCFSRTPRHDLHCHVSKFKHTADLELLHDQLKPLLIRALCTAAFSVLNSTGDGKTQSHPKEHLSINVSNNVLSSEKTS